MRKKLYRGEFIEVDPQIALWRKHRRDKMPKLTPFKTRANASAKAERDVYARVALTAPQSPQEEAFKSILDMNLFE